MTQDVFITQMIDSASSTFSWRAPKGAVFSECRTWRYLLWRKWNEASRNVAFICLNPSTADEEMDDPTIRRCITLAKAWGYGGMYMLNIFAYRATDPRVMLNAHDPIGTDNDRYLRDYAKFSEVTVAAWGTHGFFMNRGPVVKKMIPNLMCLGVTKAGHPKHPLYLRADVTPEPFNA